MMLEQRTSRILTVVSFGDSTLGQSGVDKKKKGDIGVSVLEELREINCIDFACGSFFNVVAESNTNSKSRRVWVWGTMNYTKHTKAPTEKKTDKSSLPFEKEDEIPSTPHPVPYLNKKFVIQVSAGDSHAAALTMEGDVYTWGIYKDKKGVSFGFRGDRPKTEFQDEPELADIEEYVVQIGSTPNKTLALTESGDIYEWGETSLTKRVVSRHTKDSLAPAFIYIGKKICKFFCGSGGEQVFAVTADNVVYSWGYDKFFQLGLFSTHHEKEKEVERVKREKEREEKRKEQEKKR